MLQGCSFIEQVHKNKQFFYLKLFQPFPVEQNVRVQRRPARYTGSPESVCEAYRGPEAEIKAQTLQIMDQATAETAN